MDARYRNAVSSCGSPRLGGGSVFLWVEGSPKVYNYGPNPNPNPSLNTAAMVYFRRVWISTHIHSMHGILAGLHRGQPYAPWSWQGAAPVWLIPLWGLHPGIPPGRLPARCRWDQRRKCTWGEVVVLSSPKTFANTVDPLYRGHH